MPNSFLPSGAYTILGQAWSISLEWQFYLLAPAALWLISTQRWLALLGLVAALLILAPLNGAMLGNYVLLFGVGIASYMHMAGRWPIAVPLICAAAAVLFGGLAQMVPLCVWVLARHAGLDRKLFLFLGSRSYSTYLLHMLPIYVGAYWLNLMQIGGAAYVLLLATFVVGFTLALSEVAYRFVEKPGMALGKRLASKSNLHNVPAG